MIQKNFVSILVVLSFQLIVVSNFTRGNMAQLDYPGIYRNHKYGYSVPIPSGLVARTDPPPAPQHGVTMLLSDNSKEQIWIDGSYNAVLWPTTDSAVNAHIDWLRKEADGVNQLSRRTIRLGRLRAVRDVTRYEDRATGEVMVQDLILAMRTAKGEGHILYTIGLRTRESDYEKHKLFLADIINGWRVERLSY